MNDINLSSGIDRSRHKILVVDDNPATSYSTARTFRAAGFMTAEASTGTEALTMSLDGVSVIVLDVHLPDIDGFEVSRRLRENPKTKSLPVVHLSAAFIDDKDKAAGLNSGADAYLTHPAEPPILIATVQALIRARLAEDQVRKSEAKFRAIYTEAESGIALVDSSGGFVETNPAMLRMLGRASEDVIGHKIWEFATEESTQLVRALVEREDSAVGQWREVFSLTVPDKDDVFLEWTMSQHIEPGLRVGIVTNISARMKFQEQRERLLDREKAARTIAEQHSQTKDNFIAILSHELRNPLNAIQMAVDVLLAKNAAPEMVGGLQMIKRNVNSQARIIADILDMSRLSSGKMALERELIDPTTLISTSIEAMKSAINNRQLKVNVDMVSATKQVWLDATRFQQIFWNIFGNAIKFSEPGGSVAVSLANHKQVLTLVIQDHGKGIEQEFLKTIFDKFTQGVTPGNRSHGGLGLGMTIVNELTHLHGGTVRVESEGLGQGTKVTVEIPIVSALSEDNKMDINTQYRDNDVDLSGVDILVVEDEPQNREMLSLILKDRGAHVRTAGSYDEALKALTEAKPDLIVSDVGLPGRDGYELIYEIRRRESVALGSCRIPAIAVTAFGRSEDISRALAVGFDAHLAKPLNALDLLAVVSKSVIKKNF